MWKACWRSERDTEHLRNFNYFVVECFGVQIFFVTRIYRDLKHLSCVENESKFTDFCQLRWPLLLSRTQGPAGWRAAEQQCCQGGQRLKRGGPDGAAKPQDNAITVGMRVAWMTWGNHGASRNVHPLGAHMVFHSDAGVITPTLPNNSHPEQSIIKKKTAQMQTETWCHIIFNIFSYIILISVQT